VGALGSGPVPHRVRERGRGAHRRLGDGRGCTALTPLVRRARRDAFTVGRLNAQQEPREAEGASSRSGLIAARRE
jgi:hypothetical protein